MNCDMNWLINELAKLAVLDAVLYVSVYAGPPDRVTAASFYFDDAQLLFMFKF